MEILTTIFGLAFVVALPAGMAAQVHWMLKHRRTPPFPYGLNLARAEHPILYWIHVGGALSVLALLLTIYALVMASRIAA